MARRTRRSVVTGDEELDRKLKKIVAKQFRGVSRKAGRKAMNPVRKATRQNVPVEDGFLKKSIGTVQRSYKKSGVIVTIVGARKGFKDTETGKDPSNYAHLVEFGVTPHAIATKSSPVLSGIGSGVDGEVFGTKVRHPGFSGFGFQRKSFDQTKGKVMQVYVRELDVNIAKEVKKL